MLPLSVSLGPSFTKVKQLHYVKFQPPLLSEKQTLRPHMFQAQFLLRVARCKQKLIDPVHPRSAH